MNELASNGFDTIDSVYSADEINQILTIIEQTEDSSESFRKSKDLFAIRRVCMEIPGLAKVLFNDKLRSIVKELGGEKVFLSKSIYFDKPATSNWFVAYHQDLMITVDQKHKLKNFGPWIKKDSFYNVQPPLEILQNNFTIRIHLDDTNEDNGALRVISKSHLKGVYRPETIDWKKEKEVICSVLAGGVMLMKPLLLHSSSRTTNDKRRRVIHLEFSNKKLPEGMNWAEYQKVGDI